jgi:hypothetical protein
MTEIPTPDYGIAAPPAEKKSSPMKLILVVVVIAIVAVASTLVVLNMMSANTPSLYDEREIASYNNTNINLYPTYYRAEFDVYSSEVLTSTPPDLLFEITVQDTGSDSVSVTVHIAVYNTDLATVDGASTWAELDTYLMGEGDYTDEPVAAYADLENYASTYVWVIWFEAAYKTSTWSIDITLTLRYNWNL